MFQSAPRERGESSGCQPCSCSVNVSIRAPRTGRKSAQVMSPDPPCCFNPRPANGAKGCDHPSFLILPVFQSAPRERGERIPAEMLQPFFSVSIRAPRTGRKDDFPFFELNWNCFNPRPANGAKGRFGFLARLARQFQSAPRERGERCRPRQKRSSLSGFNPRPANGAKVDSLAALKMVWKVSIRAPRTGRKPTTNITYGMSALFQSAPRERGESTTASAAAPTADEFQSAPRERGEST